MHDLAKRVDNEWKRLQRRLNWTFTDNEAVLLDAVIADLRVRSDVEHVTDVQISAVVLRHYNRRLFNAFVAGRMNPGDDAAVHATNRASEEIWGNAWRQVRAKGYDDNRAAEVAQMVVERLLEEPSRVRDPGSLVAWIKWQILDFLPRVRDNPKDAWLDQEDAEHHSQQLSMTDEAITAVENAIVARQVMAALPEIISPFQLQVIEQVVLGTRSAAEAAEALGVRPTQIRVEKSRALEKIRKYLADIEVWP